MSKIPAVSVIMPVYNAGEFLHLAVQSIFGQTFSDWELIAIDDGSTDSSWEYLQLIDDPRVKVIRNERNRGVSYTNNRAVDLARGKWIAKMDADDIVAATRFEKQIIALEKDPTIDVLGCGSLCTDKDLNLVYVDRPKTMHEDIIHWPSLYYPLMFGALMGKAEWWKKWRMDVRSGISGHEFDLYFRSHLDSVFGNIPDMLYVYRFVGHTRSMTKMTKSVYHKSMTLIHNGFRMGIPFTTLFGLASMAPRPLLYAIKFAIGSKTGLVPSQAAVPTKEEKELLKQILAQVSEVRVPLKQCANK